MPVRFLRGLWSWLAALSGALGTILLFVAVLVALPLFVAGVLVDYMLYRPEREEAVLARLATIEAALLGDASAE